MVHTGGLVDLVWWWLLPVGPGVLRIGCFGAGLFRARHETATTALEGSLLTGARG
jgi:hypothetical protein